MFVCVWVCGEEGGEIVEIVFVSMCMCMSVSVSMFVCVYIFAHLSINHFVHICAVPLKSGASVCVRMCVYACLCLSLCVCVCVSVSPPHPTPHGLGSLFKSGR